MFTLTIVLYTTIGIFHPVILTGKPEYMTREICEKAGEQVVNWLAQDFMQVKFECNLNEEEKNHEEGD